MYRRSISYFHPTLAKYDHFARVDLDGVPRPGDAGAVVAAVDDEAAGGDRGQRRLAQRHPVDVRNRLDDGGAARGDQLADAGDEVLLGAGEGVVVGDGVLLNELAVGGAEAHDGREIVGN
mgnify:CR=1 FL=1